MSKREIHNRYVTDSETGETFRVTRYSDYNLYYKDGKLYPMESVLGYFRDGYSYAVSKHLVTLLGYIEDIRFTDKEVDDSIRVSWDSIGRSSENGVLVKLCTSGKVCSVLDAMMCMSYNTNFLKMLEKGSCIARFGFDTYMHIIFCKDVRPYIGKLIAFYRETDDFQKRIDMEGLL